MTRTKMLWAILLIVGGILSVSAIGANTSRLFWAKKIDPALRFSVLSDFNDEAVLDNETGLVWERSPIPQEGQPLETPRFDAFVTCAEKTVGGRKGWRLPKIEELSSLVDPSQTTVPTLPLGHPFLNISSESLYWSATILPREDGTTNGLLMGFNTPDNPVDSQSIGNPNRYWCVRGGSGHDGGQ